MEPTEEEVVQEATPVVLNNQILTVTDSASVTTFKKRIKRALMSYLADCEDTETIPGIYGFNGFVKYLTLATCTRAESFGEFSTPLYKEDEFKL
jgi:hypothetical protein